MANAVSVPHPTPASRSATPAPDSPAPPSDAVEAAAKIAAQVAIVSGFEAVAASEVAKARPGEPTSSGSSPPSLTRNAAHSVRTPITPSTTAPSAPSPTRSASISSRLAAPARPRLA